MLESPQELYNRQIKERKEKEAVQPHVVQTQRTQVSSVVENKLSFDTPMIQDIRNSLSVSGFEKEMNLSDTELNYVSSVFVNKGFTDIKKINSDAIMKIGNAELEKLNLRLKALTTQIGNSKGTILYTLIDDLSNEVERSELPTYYNKAINTKPTIGARLLSIFDKKASSKSISEQYSNTLNKVKLIGCHLEAKLLSIEGDLNQHKIEQGNVINRLNTAFDDFYEAFIELRKQFALIVYVEHCAKKQYEAFCQEHQDSTDLMLNKEMTTYKGILDDIQDKRLLLHRTLLHLPITNLNYSEVIKVCKNVIREIDKTIIISMPMIRGNIIGIHSALIAQQGMLSAKSANDLYNNTSAMQNILTEDLSIQSEKMVADNHLKSANAVDAIIDDIRNRKAKIDAVRLESEQKMKEVDNILTNATRKLAEHLNER